MNDLVMIRPDRGEIGSLAFLEISLGGAPRGMVLLLCDREGLDRDATEVMNRFAEHGYESLAAEATRTSLEPLLRRAAERGWAHEQIGVVGLGLGGRLAAEAAGDLRLGAAVSLSPTVEAGAPGTLADLPGRIETPWLVLFGAEDPGAPADEVRALARRLRVESDVYSRVVSYPGVGRNFYRHHDDGLSYAASYDGWQRAIEWLELRVVPRLTPLAQKWRKRKDSAAA